MSANGPNFLSSARVRTAIGFAAGFFWAGVGAAARSVSEGVPARIVDIVGTGLMSGSALSLADQAVRGISRVIKRTRDGAPVDQAPDVVGDAPDITTDVPAAAPVADDVATGVPPVIPAEAECSDFFLNNTTNPPPVIYSESAIRTSADSVEVEVKVEVEVEVEVEEEEQQSKRQRV